MDEQFWNDKYTDHDRLWSGEPNGALVTEATDLPPGRALDVGCGEGADALWLANRGWQVTAVDISRVALDRAARLTAPYLADGAAGYGTAEVVWQHADLSTDPPPAGGFDLVSAQYFPLPRAPEHKALHALLDAVAPGGTLLFVGHDLDGHLPEDYDGPDPADFYQPGEIAALLGEDWTILTNETRRRVAAPAGNPHINDTVLRARRHPA